MKYTSTNGDKREAQLKFRYKELKKSGKLRQLDDKGEPIKGKSMSLREFRNSEFNKSVAKEVIIVTKKGKKLSRKVIKFVSLEALTEARDFTFPAAKEPKSVVFKSERREARRHLKHVILKMIQEAAALRKEQKKLNRELRIAHAQERKDLKVRQELERIVLRVAA